MSNLTASANTSAAITAQVSSESEALLLEGVVVGLSVDIETSPLIDDAQIIDDSDDRDSNDHDSSDHDRGDQVRR